MPSFVQKLRDSQAMKEVFICYWCGEEKNAARMMEHLRGKCTGYHCTDGLSNEMRDVFSNPDIKAATAEEWAIHYPVEPGTKKGMCLAGNRVWSGNAWENPAVQVLECTQQSARRATSLTSVRPSIRRRGRLPTTTSMHARRT
jgi:hypothetical protein